jgi:hypothetical protein
MKILIPTPAENAARTALCPVTELVEVLPWSLIFKLDAMRVERTKKE